MYKCDRCEEFGISFNRKYKPSDFIEGKLNSYIWIIGLNPGQEEGWGDKLRDKSDLLHYFDDLEEIHPYFKDFKKVSEKMFFKFGEDNGVAHTDLVKCASKSWPPKGCKGKVNERTLINNCSEHLKEQIVLHKPKMIICNGAPVSHKIKDILNVDRLISDTAYESNINGITVVVVLSGFIGRIDDFSKRRLGYEIENLMSM